MLFKYFKGTYRKKNRKKNVYCFSVQYEKAKKVRKSDDSEK